MASSHNKQNDDKRCMSDENGVIKSESTRGPPFNNHSRVQYVCIPGRSTCSTFLSTIVLLRNLLAWGRGRNTKRYWDFIRLLFGIFSFQNPKWDSITSRGGTVIVTLYERHRTTPPGGSPVSSSTSYSLRGSQCQGAPNINFPSEPILR